MTNGPRIDSSCNQAPGVFSPAIDRNRCEGKGECVKVCPKHVFALGVLPKAERGNLSLLGKLKGFAHGWQQAFLPNVAACEACGLCVAACPEAAITLTRTSAR
jgi:NAD-dependent dihydropyrimidine dehydrogenase PreA subunit